MTTNLSLLNQAISRQYETLDTIENRVGELESIVYSNFEDNANSYKIVVNFQHQPQNENISQLAELITNQIHQQYPNMTFTVNTQTSPLEYTSITFDDIDTSKYDVYVFDKVFGTHAYISVSTTQFAEQLPNVLHSNTSYSSIESSYIDDNHRYLLQYPRNPNFQLEVSYFDALIPKIENNKLSIIVLVDDTDSRNTFGKVCIFELLAIPKSNI